MSDGDLPEVDELFELDPEEFVGARDALARRLRSAGQKEEAAAVKALRRPTVAAWALNQLVRRHGDEVRALIAEGGELAVAQGRALAGEGAGLREATQRRREAIRQLAQRADVILDDRNPGVHRDDVVGTLTAASADPEAGERLLGGRLTVPIPATTGFEGTAVAAPPERSRPAGKPAAKGEAARARAEQEAAEARQAADEERALADEAVAAAEAAAEAADASDEQARKLEAELEQARRVAGDDARRAREAAGRAASANRRAEAAEERARKAAERGL